MKMNLKGTATIYDFFVEEDYSEFFAHIRVEVGEAGRYTISSENDFANPYGDYREHRTLAPGETVQDAVFVFASEMKAGLLKDRG